MAKKKVHIYLSEEAWNRLREFDNMSRHIEELILKRNDHNSLIAAMRDFISNGCNKDDENIGRINEIDLELQDSIMNLLDL